MSTLLALGLLLAVTEVGAAPNAESLARQIDQQLAARFEAETVVPAPLADDQEFLRRLSLDLLGRIPLAAEVRQFLADDDTDKRAKLIDRMLASPEHVNHQAQVWWSLLVPEAETEPQLRYFETGFKAWLTPRLQPDTGFDRLVQDLVSVPIAAPDEAPQAVMRDLTAPNPFGFYASKNAEPAKIASSAVRLFLGLRLECAQCHNHPYDNWTQEQFWSQAAFFAGIERRGKGPFAPLIEDPARETISPLESKITVRAMLLSEAISPAREPKFDRTEFGRWMASTENPYFAAAISNRVWSQLMGLGIVEPVDDFRASNAPSHPELLDMLAESFTASGFRVALLESAICRSQAYQRTSRQTDASQTAPERFARAAVRPMSSDQFHASVMLAIAHEPAPNRVPGEPEIDRVRNAAKKIVSDATPIGDPQTSVAQVLALMNGDVTNRAARVKTSPRLQQVLAEFAGSPAEQIESLYLTTLSRVPTADEQRLLADYYQQADAEHQAERLGDIFWMLLNQSEFRWNH